MRGLLFLGACRLEHAADRLQDGVAVHRLAARLLQQADHGCQLIESHEHQFGHVASDGQLAVPGGVEDVFDLVGQVVDVRQPEHGRQTLEAVGRAEHLVQQAIVAALVVVFAERLHPFVQLQQVRIELGEKLVRLVEEVAQQAVQQFVFGFWLRVAHRSLPFIAAAVGITMAAGERNP